MVELERDGQDRGRDGDGPAAGIGGTTAGPVSATLWSAMTATLTVIAVSAHQASRDGASGGPVGAAGVEGAPGAAATALASAAASRAAAGLPGADPHRAGPARQPAARRRRARAGFMLKDARPQELVAAIRDVAACCA
ncbi:hypothetical protein [Nonomuraea ceibae]|uniref:hypothetical protein n=1 Tax=Nonomuraea ceibae TaxID=1935170 RepID=UPI001C5E454F|nr:hypothetical protein [Nonomuraea ceibae]